MKKLKFILSMILCVATMSFSACSGLNGNKTAKGSDPVYIFSLNKSNLELETGESFALVAVHGEDTITYKSSDVSVATVDENGVVTAVSEGVAYIYINSESDGLSCKVTVSNPVYSIELSETGTVILANNATKSFMATSLSDGVEYNGEIVWSVTNAENCILTVDGNFVTFKSATAGVYTLTASNGKASASCEIKVLAEGTTELSADLS